MSTSQLSLSISIAEPKKYSHYADKCDHELLHEHSLGFLCFLSLSRSLSLCLARLEKFATRAE